jgi:hypothetical protein
MSFTLTVQQRLLRCRCGRYLAWWTTEHAMCCGCMKPSERCRCRPTADPREGCHAIDLEHIAEPEGEDLECE